MPFDRLVREVQSRHVHAGLEQGAHLLEGVGGGAERADDLGAPVRFERPGNGVFSS
jgi:hypothetical protein